MEPVIRRVVAARVVNPADVDDLVQDCLERLLMARGRLAPGTVLPYAVVTARNLVSSQAKSAMRRAAAAPRILDVSEPERPDEALLVGEARNAMMSALAQLSDQERSDILAYYGDVSPETAQTPESRGAVRVRMARTRAKLRLEYLLAFRHVELPSAACRSVLLAISAGDTRRQRDLNAGRHLLDCRTCGTLSEPLDRRSVALTAVAIPGALAARALATARAHPVQAAASVAAGSAAVAAAVVLGPQLSASRPVSGPAAPAPAAHVSGPAAPAPAAHVRVSGAPAPAAVISHLSVAGHAVTDAQARQYLRSLAGRGVQASGVTVVAAVTRNGFWIGSSLARIWVELTGPLRPLHIGAGDRVWFTGTVVADPPSYPARAGVSGGGAALLARQGAHVSVSTARISVES